MCKIFASELGSKSGVMRGFQKGITLGGRTLINDHTEGLRKWLQKICKILASELGSMSGVMRGFQKGIILGGGTSGSDYIEALQKWFAKKFAKYLHLSLDPSQGS